MNRKRFARMLRRCARKHRDACTRGQFLRIMRKPIIERVLARFDGPLFPGM